MKIGNKECPFIQTNGDGATMTCRINTKPCLLEEGLECDVWTELQEESKEGG